MNSVTGFLSMSLVLILTLASFIRPGQSHAQGAKMTVGQTGTNPGTSLYFIAQKENLFAKHGLDVNIVKTNTASAVLSRCSSSTRKWRG